MKILLFMTNFSERKNSLSVCCFLFIENIFSFLRKTFLYKMRKGRLL